MKTIQTMAAVVAVAIGAVTPAAAAYFSVGAGHTEASWAFPISPGGFIGGMDVIADASGNPAVIFSESGSLYRLDGGQVSPLWQAPSPLYSSFVRSDASHNRIVFSDSSAFSISQVGLDGTNERLLGTAPGSYDAAIDQSGRIFVSEANSSYTSTGVGYFDSSTGTTQTIAQFNGPAGPLAFDSSGNLIYGTSSAVFGQAGGQTLFEMTSQQIQTALTSGSIISTASMTTLATNIDTPSSMVTLPGGGLLFSSSVTSPSAIMELSHSRIAPFATLTDPSFYVTNLAFYNGAVFANVGGVYGANYAAYGAIVEIVPEPSSLLAMLAFSGMGLAAVARRKPRA